MAISLTPAAADRVRHFLAARGQGLGLRLGVRKTGCSGFAYVVDYADATRPDDLVFEDHGVRVFVDPQSLPMSSVMPISSWRATPVLVLRNFRSYSLLLFENEADFEDCVLCTRTPSRESQLVYDRSLIAFKSLFCKRRVPQLRPLDRGDSGMLLNSSSLL